MFTFFHPKSVVDVRPVAVKVIQKKTPTQQEKGILIVEDRNTVPSQRTSDNSASENLELVSDSEVD